MFIKIKKILIYFKKVALENEKLMSSPKKNIAEEKSKKIIRLLHYIL